MSKVSNYSEKYRREIFIGLAIFFIMVLGLILSFSLEARSYDFEETLEIQSSTEIYISDYPVVEELKIVADNTNTENVSFTLYGSRYDYGIEEDYSLTPGQSISSKSDTNFGGDITLRFLARDLVQKVYISVEARSNLFVELLYWGKFPDVDRFSYLSYVFIPSFVISGIMLFYLLFELAEDKYRDDWSILYKAVFPVLLFILYLVFSLSGVLFFIPIPTLVYFYYCSFVFRLKIHYSTQQSRPFLATLSLFLIFAPFYIFVSPGLDIIIALKWIGLSIFIVGLYQFSGFLIKKNTQLPFLIALGGTLVISSAFFYFAYSPFHVVIINRAKIWNTLPVLPTLVSFIISGILLVIYGGYHSRHTIASTKM